MEGFRKKNPFLQYFASLILIHQWPEFHLFHTVIKNALCQPNIYPVTDFVCLISKEISRFITSFLRINWFAVSNDLLGNFPIFRSYAISWSAKRENCELTVYNASGYCAIEQNEWKKKCSSTLLDPQDSSGLIAERRTANLNEPLTPNWIRRAILFFFTLNPRKKEAILVGIYDNWFSCCTQESAVLRIAVAEPEDLEKIIRPSLFYVMSQTRKKNHQLYGLADNIEE